MRSETWAWSFCVVLLVLLLMDLTMELAYVFELRVWCWLQNYVASATTIELGVVIILFKLWCMLNYLWTCCNMWHVCWIMYDLGCMLEMFWDPSWYSTDYRVYMGSSLCACQCVSRDSHTWSCINWSVLW
jgi:hypothetical protein